MYLFGDPAGYANGQQIPSGSFKTAMDYSRGTLMDDDWYRRGEVTNGDRAPRLTHPRNFVDYASNSQPLTLSGTVNTSGSTVTLVKEALGRDFSTCPIAAWPKSGTCWWVGLTGKFTINDVAYTVTAYRSPTQVTVTPSPGTQTAVAFTSPSPFDATPLFEPSALPGAQWLSPAPDGKGRWTMVDAAAGGCWFSRGVKTGFLLYATLGAGDVAYANGFIASTKAAHELHVYSQARLGEGVSGATPPWKVHPDAMYDLTDRLPLGPHGALQSGAYGASPGAITCDDETGDVWIRASKAGESRPGPTNYDRLYLFKCPACAPQPKFPLPLASVLAVFAASRLMRRCAP
jgi:hypothetical protein